MRTIKVLFCAALASAALASTTAAQAAPASYRIRELGPAGPSVAINNVGDVVIRGKEAADKPVVRHPDGSLTTLDSPDLVTDAADINVHGVVVGSYAGATLGRPAVWAPDGTLTTLAVGADTVGEQADAINDRGLIGGAATFLEGDGEDAHYVPHATIWSRGTRAVIGPPDSRIDDINNRGIVLGRVKQQSVIFDRDGSYQAIRNLAGAIECTAEAVNDRGEMVGSCTLQDNTRPTVYWDTVGRPHVLRAAPYQRNQAATDINDRGAIVGYTGPDDHAAVWSSYRALPVLLPDLPGSEAGDAYPDLAMRVNDRGLIVGPSDDAARGGGRAVEWVHS